MAFPNLMPERQLFLPERQFSHIDTLYIFHYTYTGTLKHFLSQVGE